MSDFTKKIHILKTFIRILIFCFCFTLFLNRAVLCIDRYYSKATNINMRVSRYVFCMFCLKVAFKLQSGPTRNGFFEFNILGTYSLATIDFDTSNFSKHADI